MYRRYKDGFEPKTTCHVVTEAAIGAAASLLGSVGSTVFNAGSSKKQREWSEKMQAQQNAWNEEMWNKTNAYNSPEQQVQRLRDAGLNPLYYGLDGSSANALESAQPLGYERAEMSAQDNPLAAGLAGYSQMKALNKEIELKNAEIDKIQAETAGIGLDNEFKDKTMEARAEGETLKNNISKEQIKNFQKERDVMQADIEKKIQEAKSEIEKQALYKAQAILEKAQADEIYSLLPAKQLLLEAQTEAQKAAASASWANAAYQNGLINGGYLDALIDQAKEEARKAGYDADTAEINKEMAAYKRSVQDGTIFTREDMRDGKTTKASRAMDFVMGKVVQTINITATALGGGISADALGTVSTSKGEKSGTSTSQSSSTLSGSK